MFASNVFGRTTTKIHSGHFTIFDADHKTVRLHDTLVTPVSQRDIFLAENPPFRSGTIVTFAVLTRVHDLPVRNVALSHALRSVTADRDRRIYGVLLRNQSTEPV